MKASLILLTLGLPLFSRANTLHVPYIGGKQTGTFTVAGDRLDAGYIDTVILGEGLFITNYLARRNPGPGSCGYTVEYGLQIRPQNGLAGKWGASDTVWMAALVFPEASLIPDTIPSPGFNLEKSLGDSARGIRVGTIPHDGECSSMGFRTTPGYNVIWYFKFNVNSLVRYGKIRIHTFTPWDDFVFPSRKGLSNVEVSYTISDTKDLNSGPVPLRAPGRQPGKIRGNSGVGPVYEADGRTYKEIPPRHGNSPLLRPKQ